jgi:hypothetical protein
MMTDDPLEQIKVYTGKFEDILESFMNPVKPYLHPPLLLTL